jgi:L-ascorbate metabolism protein UlaG (beta-lactamase superfamily)
MKWTWRQYADWAKRSHAMLRLADTLGRSRGRLRLLDSIYHAPAAPVTPDLRDWSTRSLSAVWIGHATVLLRIGGMTILTDPVFSQRVGIGLGVVTAGPTRRYAPAIALHDLPKIDLILLSHAHYDHLDRPSLVKLPKRTPVIAAQHTGDLIRDLGFRKVREMKWGEHVSLGAVSVAAHQVKHWGARNIFDSHRMFNAYVLRANSQSVLFGGDTAYQDYFKGIDGVDLAILGIGAYDPYVAAHATPEQAWEMAGHCRARHVLPMHHSTFRLSHEPMHEPMQRLLGCAGKEVDKIVVRQIGEQWTM